MSIILSACFGTTGWEYDKAHREAGCGEKSKEFRKKWGMYACDWATPEALGNGQYSVRAGSVSAAVKGSIAHCAKTNLTPIKKTLIPGGTWNASEIIFSCGTE